MRVLGIETSCDETAVAIVDQNRVIHSQLLRSQWAEHRAYGGVVPELAARAHLQILPDLARAAMQQAQARPQDLAAIAVTAGPGLIGGLLVGATYGQMLALAWDKPLLALNHLEGHALTPRFSDGIEFPYMLLLVSGGHSQFLWIEAVGKYRLLGGTLDDAVGEAFDKAAKILGLPQPGGPSLENAARAGDALRFALPVPLLGRAGCEMSLSGLKTALRQTALRLPQPLVAQDIADLAATFQSAVGKMLQDRLHNAIAMVDATAGRAGIKQFAIAGGVAANQYLRGALADTCAQLGWRLLVPPQSLCGDNAVMMAWAGIERLRLGQGGEQTVTTRPRWPLSEMTVPTESVG
jgi:N6-L-threonylcarbamoyladenine synthase